MTTRSTLLRSILSLAAYCLLLPAVQAAVFIPLGDLGPTINSSAATGISADGSVVVGTGNGTGINQEAFRWTAGTGMVGLGSFSPYINKSYAAAVSADGNVIVGTVSGVQDFFAFRWTASTGMTTMPLNTNSRAFGVSPDGNVVVGTMSSLSVLTFPTAAFRWTAAGGGVQDLGTLSSASSINRALDISDDGAVIVGQSSSSVTGGREAFRWTSGGGMVGLGLLNGTSRSVATAISGDGSIIIGNSGGRAFRWTADSGMVSLGFLPSSNPSSSYSFASAISSDGSVIVGRSSSVNSTNSDPFIWTQGNGMLSLLDVLAANGATGMNDWTFFSPTAISADGQWITGTANNPSGAREAWVASITPVPIPATVWLFGSALGILSLLRNRASGKKL